MAKTIRIRYKDSSPHWPGDVAAINNHNLPSKFDGPKYPGYEEDIPADLLDDKMATIDYKNPDGSREQITEMQYRVNLFKTGGFHRQPGSKITQPAPPHLPQNRNRLNMYMPARQLAGQEHQDFIWKTNVATLFYKHYNPVCMEFIGDIPGEIIQLLKKKYTDTKDKTYGNLIPGIDRTAPDQRVEEAQSGTSERLVEDVTKMPINDAVKFVRSLDDVDLLQKYSADEAKKSRPKVAAAIEDRLEQLEKSGAKATASPIL